MLLLVTLATEKTGSNPAKAKVPFDHLPSWIRLSPVGGITTVMFDGCFQILQGQYETIESTLFGSFSFYMNDITLNVTTCQLLFFPSTLSLRLHHIKPTWVPFIPFNCCRAFHIFSYPIFPLFCEWISGCFQFEITNSPNYCGDGDNVSKVKQPNIH